MCNEHEGKETREHKGNKKKVNEFVKKLKSLKESAMIVQLPHRERFTKLAKTVSCVINMYQRHANSINLITMSRNEGSSLKAVVTRAHSHPTPCNASSI